MNDLVPSGRPSAALTGSVGTPQGPYAPPPENAVESFFEALGRRKRLMALLFTFTLAIVVALTLAMRKEYTTHVKFIAGSTGAAMSDGGAANGQSSLPVLNALLAASSMQSSETYAEMMREAPALQRVITQLRLPLDPQQLRTHLTVRPLVNTSILDVAVTWPDPRRSADIANALAASFIALRRDLIASQADTAIAELGKQLPIAEARMRETGRELADFQARSGIADVQVQTQNALSLLNSLDTKIEQAEVDRQQAQASLKVLDAQLAKTASIVPGGRSDQPNPVYAQLKTQLATVEVQLKTAQQTYTDAHPAVKALRAQEAQVRNEIAKTPATIVAQQNTVNNPVWQQLTQQSAQLRAQVASDGAQLTVLHQQRKAYEPLIRALPAQARHLAELQRNAKLNEDVYVAMRGKLNEATVTRSTALSDVAVVEGASPYRADVSPNLVFNIIIGTILGIVVAVAGALVMDFFDRTIKTEEDVEERLALPLLGTVPALITTALKPPAPWLRMAMVESIFHLVTSLRYSSSTNPQTITFTSAAQGDGKSTIALNTAIAYAELRPRVLLVDADFRLPSLHHRLGIKNDRGLSDALVGTATFDEVIHETKHHGLDIVTSGTSTPSPMRLLQSDAFDRFLATAKERYEFVVFDAAATAVVAEAATLCTKTEGTVFVVASGQTDLSAARSAMARLHAAGVRNVLGAVLNKVRPRKSEIGAYGEVGEDGSRGMPLPPRRGRDSSRAPGSSKELPSSNLG